MIDPLELERRAYASLFDLMEEYRGEHPDATDDECYEAVCFGVIPDRVSAAVDYEKERRRECQ
jgi:hypothetical protein